ncbi:hypothetical protein O0L34_g6628 [Tuta absoluta]|nr:hypothetical protein O0L34_g6628 [Tuta absoluta]
MSGTRAKRAKSVKLFESGLCRCCGALRRCRDLNYEYENGGAIEVYSDMIMDCFGFTLSDLDSMSTERLICATCVRRLRDAFAFKKQVLQCEEDFKQTGNYYETKAEKADYVKTEQLIKTELVMESTPSPHADEQSDSFTNDSTVEILIVPDIPNKPSNKRKRDERPKRSLVVKKEKSVISEKQENSRVQETNQKIVTNLLTIVEHSYVCPFKWSYILQCFYCKKSFPDMEELRVHTEQSHKPSEFSLVDKKKNVKMDISRIDCRLCETKIEDLEEFKKHITSVHDKEYYLDCIDLIMPFKLKRDEWICVICHKEFPYFHALNKHMNEHFNNFVCESCGLGFVDFARLSMHQLSHGNQYPCDECGKQYTSEYRRDLHIDTVHKKQGRIKCPKCDVLLLSYSHKLKHLVEVHGEAPLTFPCSMCDKVMNSRKKLTAHKRRDHYRDYKHECNICDTKFYTNSELQDHTRTTHTGERKFKCQLCDKAFFKLKTLRIHTRIHANDRRYRCDLCEQAFVQNASLKSHMRSQHPGYTVAYL